MSASIFNDKSAPPDEKQVAESLDKAYDLWGAFRTHLTVEYGDIHEEWKHYGKSSGWVLKSLLKKRNLFFFIPLVKSFRINFVFGDKAVAVIEKSDLPEDLKQSLREARKYMEGRGLQVEVSSMADVDLIKVLVAIKINN
jgi:hypothetical protein